MEGSEVRGKGYFCLRFAHCHNGFHIGDLRVYNRVGNGPRHTWWSLAGDFGPHWHTAAVQLNLTSVAEVGVFDVRYMTYISSGKSIFLITRAHAAHARTCVHADALTHKLTYTYVTTPTRTHVRTHKGTRKHTRNHLRMHLHTHTYIHRNRCVSFEQVGFEYQTGGHHSDMALDEVTMKHGKCEGSVFHEHQSKQLTAFVIPYLHCTYYFTYPTSITI